MKDRRLHPRAPLETAVDCQLAQSKGSLKALSRDIGAGGLGIVTSANLSVGTALSRVRLTLPAEDKIPEATLELGAQVVRCSAVSENALQFVAGLQFLEATRSDLERIEDYVFRRLSPEAQAEATAAHSSRDEEEDKVATAADNREDFDELVEMVDGEAVDLDFEEERQDTAEIETERESQSRESETPVPDGGDPDAPPQASPRPVEEFEEAPARRVPFSQPISIRFDLFKDFVKEVSANISTSGIFIKAAKPRKIGSILEFSFDMGDDFTLLQGRGEVVWARHQREGPDLPPGMGIRFIDLDPSSTNVIKRIVADHAAQGHQPFDLDASAPADLPLAEAGVEDTPATDDGGELVEFEEVNPELRERLRTLMRAKRERDELLHRLKKSEREKYSLEKELAGIGAGAQKAQLGWKARLAELEETVQDAETVETDLKSKLQELAGSLAATLEERDRVAAQYDELAAKQEELAGQLDTHHGEDAEIEALTEETERLRKETAAKQEELAQEVEAARSEAADARSRAEALEKETEELRSRLAEGGTQLERLEAELSTARESAKKLDEQQGKISELETTLAESHRELEGVRTEMSRLEEDRSRLESKVAEDATLIAAARDSADALSSARNDFEAQLNLAAETESELTARISELEAEAASARREGELNLEQSGVQRAELKTKLERALEEMDRLLDSSERAKRDFEAELAEKVSALQQAEEKQAELQTNVETLDRGLQAALGEVESVRDSADNNLTQEREKIQQARTKLSEVEQELAAAIQSRTDLESERQKIEEELRAELDHAREKTEQQGVLVSELEGKLEASAETEEEMSKRLGQLEKELEAKVRASAETEGEMSKRLGELEKELEAKVRAAAETEEEMSRRVGELENQLEAKASASTEIEKELETALASLEETRRRSDEELAELRRESEQKENEFQERLAAASEAEQTLDEELATLRREAQETAENASREQAELRRELDNLETELANERAAAESRGREIAAAARLDGGSAPLPYPSSPATQRRSSRVGPAISGLAAGLILGAVAVFALFRFGDLDLPGLPAGADTGETRTAELTEEDRSAASTTTGGESPTATGAEIEEATETAVAAGAGEPTGEDPTGGAATAAEPATAAAPIGTEVAASAPDPTTADDAVLAWAASWSDQRVDDYLSHYAAGFAPADGSARSDWVQQRRVRVARPASLEVTVRGLETDVLAPDRVRVVFNQVYQSDTFGDEVNKTLELVWEEDAWKIVSEVSEPS